MKSDVFIVAALEDKDKAALLVRRLRALKFKPRFDPRRSHTTPTAKDLKDATQSRTVLVLWSRAACDSTQVDSDWVHAMAHLARSRREVLLQAGLDRTIPDEPFNVDRRYALEGLTSRKPVEGFVQLVGALGTLCDRPDLMEWVSLRADQESERLDWLKAHPHDPLARDGSTMTASEYVEQLSPSQDQGTADLRTDEPINLQAENYQNSPEDELSEEIKPQEVAQHNNEVRIADAEIQKAENPAPATIPLRPESASPVASDPELAPKTPSTKAPVLQPPVRSSLSEAVRPTTLTLKRPVLPPQRPPSTGSIKISSKSDVTYSPFLIALFIGVGLLFLSAYFARSRAMGPAIGVASQGRGQGLAATACPAGQIPAALLAAPISPNAISRGNNRVLTPGEIIDDTQ